MSEYSDKASIYTIPCPGLVEFVEKGILDGPELTAHLEFLLKDVSDINIDAVDISIDALELAKENAKLNNVKSIGELVKIKEENIFFANDIKVQINDFINEYDGYKPYLFGHFA